MQRIRLTIIVFGFLATGCHTSKQVQRAVKADTVITASPAQKLTVTDSAAILKSGLAAALQAPFDFSTFYGKAKANFNSPQASGNVTIYIRMQKDSIIWMSVTGPFNIEGARILITPDSVKIMNKLEQKIQLSSISHLQQLTKLPFTFTDFQNIILGRAVLTENNQVNYTITQDSVAINETQDLLQYVYTFTKNNFLLGQINLQTTINNKATAANIFLNDYATINNTNFSQSRDIAVTGATPLTLQLNFKEYNFNQPQSFPFTISKNYKIEYE